MKTIIKSRKSLILVLIASLLSVQAIWVAAPVKVNEQNHLAQPLFQVLGYSHPSPTGYSPGQVRAAYNLPRTGGNGTIAIIIAFNYPTARNDLTNFSRYYGLPVPNATNNIFEIHNMTSNFLTYNNTVWGTMVRSWNLEAALDIEWAHAIAPNAKILLVQARSSTDNDLLDAVNYARNRVDVIAVSMSWGRTETSGITNYDSYFTSTNGRVAFFASSGDSGTWHTPPLWPSVSSNVIAVGGTTVTFGQNGSVSETSWSGSGGGISKYVTEPSYQVAYGVSGTNGYRAVPDVSYDADPNTGVSVYDTTPYANETGWFQLGGTSIGAPQWAAIQSLGLSASSNSFYQDAKSALYSHYFRDITSGSNGNYSANTGYDMVTGLGSPLTTNYVPNAWSVGISPNSITMDVGQSKTFYASALSGTAPYSYYWGYGTSVQQALANAGNSNPTSSASWSFAPSSTGSYFVAVIGKDSVGTQQNTWASITVNSALSGSISPTSTYMKVGQSQQFLASASGGTVSQDMPYIYYWGYGTTMLQALMNAGQNGPTRWANYTFTPSASGNYYVMVIVKDVVSAQQNSAATVTVFSINISPSTVTMNIGQSQNFTVTASGGTTPYIYYWGSGTTMLQALTNAALNGPTSSTTWTFTPSASGSYIVLVELVDAQGRQVSSTASVTVNP